MLFKILARLFLRSMPDVIWKNVPADNSITLSFDDGPDPAVTPRVLKILSRYNVPAVFFLSGFQIEKNRNGLKHIRYNQHEVGNHAYYHSPYIWGSSGKFRAEIEKTDELIKKYFRKKPIYFRPPFGIWGPGLEKGLNSRHIKMVLWSLMANDFKWPAQKVYEYLCHNLETGDIVVFHDTEKSKETLLEVLPLFIEYCLNMNYHFEILPGVNRNPERRVD